MNNLGKNILPMVSYAVAVSLHPLWVYIFMIKYDMKLYGIGIAGTITNILTFIMMEYLLHSQKDIKEALFWPKCTELWSNLG